MSDKSKLKEIMTKMLQENGMMNIGIVAALATSGECTVHFTIDEDGEYDWNFVESPQN